MTSRKLGTVLAAFLLLAGTSGVGLAGEAVAEETRAVVLAAQPEVLVARQAEQAESVREARAQAPARTPPLRRELLRITQTTPRIRPAHSIRRRIRIIQVERRAALLPAGVVPLPQAIIPA